MADYIISNGELHNMDELKHAKFKYLYKKKVNGKWRYYYEGDSMDAGKKKDGVLSLYYKDRPGKYGTYLEDESLGYGDSSGKNRTIVSATNNRSLFSKTVRQKGTGDKTIDMHTSGLLEDLGDQISDTSKMYSKKAKKWLNKLFGGKKKKKKK